MTTATFVIRFSVVVVGLSLVTIIALAGFGLFDARVDNARLYPMLATLSTNASSTLSTILGAWVAFEFGKVAIDRLEERLKEAVAEITRLRAQLETKP